MTVWWLVAVAYVSFGAGMGFEAATDPCIQTIWKPDLRTMNKLTFVVWSAIFWPLVFWHRATHWID